MFLQVVARFSLFFHVFKWFCVFFIFQTLGQVLRAKQLTVNSCSDSSELQTVPAYRIKLTNGTVVSNVPEHDLKVRNTKNYTSQQLIRKLQNVLVLRVFVFVLSAKRYQLTR